MLARARARMLESKERIKAGAALKSRSLRLGELAVFADGDEGDEVEVVERTVDAMNGAVDKIAKSKKPKNKLSGEELEKWKKNRRRVKEISQRQADASYYTILVFDTAGQCQAFLDYLMSKRIIGRDGDMFIDGRHVAEIMGIPLPAPEYQMTTSVTLSGGKTKGMAKVPRGYK